MRQVVAWLTPVRWTTTALLWAIGLAPLLPAALAFPLRTTAPMALAAAVCRSIAFTAGAGRLGPATTAWTSAAVLAADALLLTELLDITGGPFNPFIVVYGVYVWLAAVRLRPAHAALVGLVAAGSFGWLMIDHLRAGLVEHHRLSDFPTHLFVMGFAGSAVAELTAHYIARSRAALAERQRLLDAARERAARSDRLAALTTLAAGAAHELSTPLATIAVASRELQRSADRLPPGTAADGIREDARLIRLEIDRCHRILDSMSGRAGDWTPAGATTVSAVVAAARGGLPEDLQRRLEVRLADAAGGATLDSPSVAQALGSLLRNAFDATSGSGLVKLRVSRHDGAVRFEVEDRGAGMADDVRRRVGEPFFTTKPGRGLGLGLFLARSIAEQAGGSLELSAGEGTTAVLEIPAAAPGAAAS